MLSIESMTDYIKNNIAQFTVSEIKYYIKRSITDDNVSVIVSGPATAGIKYPDEKTV